jgi:hypothetical protein
MLLEFNDSKYITVEEEGDELNFASLELIYLSSKGERYEKSEGCLLLTLSEDDIDGNYRSISIYVDKNNAGSLVGVLNDYIDNMEGPDSPADFTINGLNVAEELENLRTKVATLEQDIIALRTGRRPKKHG